MNILLYRIAKKVTYTIGRIYFAGCKCDSLENPVRELLDINGDGDFNDPGEGKIYGQTAIPAGKYEIKMEMSPHFKRMMPYLQDVPGFSYVMIHAGQDERDTAGCILIGENTKPGKLVNSRAWSDLLNKKLLEAEERGERNYIEIIDK